MAKIRNSQPKQSGGGYERLVGNKAMAEIFTKAQSTVISNGTELEKLISSKSKLVDNLDDFIDACDMGTVSDATYLCTKKTVKASKYRLPGHEPDFIAFKVDRAKNLRTSATLLSLKTVTHLTQRNLWRKKRCCNCL